ncbi:MAG: hypothetical protein KGI10_02040 [Thaumarchaeota archaeon]|nr:hypothetical protein [Nitrososphaerota archaeon]
MGKIELSDWRQRLRGPFTSAEHIMSDNWKSCALEKEWKKNARDLDRIKDLPPETVNMGFEFSTVKR